jgi:divalent metal cation (Fe/Co/Zn/Cd) transporter
MRGYGGRKRLPDVGELVGIVLLAVMALWGLWFGLQSLLTLFWPINVLYALAGAIVAVISAAVARALLNR